MKLGMVTYLWGAKWDLPTLLKNCEETGFEAVELRSTHAHGVEPSLSKAERAEVRKRFEDSPVTLSGLGSACEYHSPDAKVVRENVELTKRFLQLADDVNGRGVKVRPNRLIEDEEPARTVERIANALLECGEFAETLNQEVRVEVHGPGTSNPVVMKAILDAVDHPHVTACWNSNPTDVVDGSVEKSFDLLNPHIGSAVHVHDLYDEAYPYRELFTLLRANGFAGDCLSESPATADPLRVMRYYRALFDELTRA